MRVFVDGRDDILLIDGPTRFEELLEELKEVCEDLGRTIEVIKIDGKIISPQEISDYLDRDVNEFQLVEFETSGSIEGALDELVEANSIMLDTAEIVRQFLDSGSMNYQDVVMSVINAMNSWERACRKIDEAARTLNVDYTTLKFSDTDFCQQHKKSMEIIQSLTEALSVRDVVTIRDVLEYEFLPQIDTYSGLIKAIVENFKQNFAKE